MELQETTTATAPTRTKRPMILLAIIQDTHGNVRTIEAGNAKDFKYACGTLLPNETILKVIKGYELKFAVKSAIELI